MFELLKRRRGRESVYAFPPAPGAGQSMRDGPARRRYFCLYSSATPLLIQPILAAFQLGYRV